MQRMKTMVGVAVISLALAAPVMAGGREERPASGFWDRVEAAVRVVAESFGLKIAVAADEGGGSNTNSACSLDPHGQPIPCDNGG